MTQGIEIKVTVPVEIYWDEEVYVARCPSFKISSQGDTVEEARNNIEEAISILIEDCIESGTLEEVLKDCGWKPASASSKSLAAPSQLPLPDTIIHDVSVTLPAYSIPELVKDTLLCPA